MARINALLVAVGLAAGAVGCAQCDTCDDFPSPCSGPNCAGAYNTGPGAVAYNHNHGGPSTDTAPATMSPAKPSDDSAGPIPPPPPANPGAAAPAGPASGEMSPPLPTEPAVPRTRPGL